MSTSQRQKKRENKAKREERMKMDLFPQVPGARDVVRDDGQGQTVSPTTCPGVKFIFYDKNNQTNRQIGNRLAYLSVLIRMLQIKGYKIHDTCCVMRGFAKQHGFMLPLICDAVVSAKSDHMMDMIVDIKQELIDDKLDEVFIDQLSLNKNDYYVFSYATQFDNSIQNNIDQTNDILKLTNLLSRDSPITRIRYQTVSLNFA